MCIIRIDRDIKLPEVQEENLEEGGKMLYRESSSSSCTLCICDIVQYSYVSYGFCNVIII